jgi:hypothetical protein
MNIPAKFKIAGFETEVVIVDNLQDNLFGYYDCAQNKIYLAKNVKSEYNGNVTLTLEQIENTFWHEYMHAVQFFLGLEFNEQQAQSIANFLFEFNKTAQQNIKFDYA